MYYKGINGNARAFAEEMESSGIADSIRVEEVNMKRLEFLLIIGILACVTGCQKQSSPEQPVGQEMNESVEAIEEPVEEAIEDDSDESLSDVFKNFEKTELSEQDFTFEYEDNTFSLSNTWSEYVDVLGYPEEYEQNNYGYISTNDTGYVWGMCYPSQGYFDYGFHVVFVSSSMERDGTDTYVDHVTLKQVETFRGIKTGDSVNDLAAAYGKPDNITVNEGNAEWSEITYTYLNYSIVFVVSDDKVLFVNLYG